MELSAEPGTFTDLSLGTVRPVPGGPWDRFVESAPGASFCHRAAWTRILQDVLGAEPLHRVVKGSSGAWMGILPLYRVQSRLFGHYLVSVPYLNYGGPLGTSAARHLLLEDAADEARRTRADLLELRTRHPVKPCPRHFQRNERKVTVVLDLPSDPDELFRETLRSKVRSQVRRPMNEGLEPRFGPDQVEPFLTVFQRTMRDLGTPVLPAELFRALPSAFGEEVTFGAVYRGQQPVAAGCGFAFRGEFEMTWAASLREHQRVAPNMLLYWAFMERQVERGIGRFNFGRCTPGGGTHRFKTQWGGRDEPLPWYQWSPAGTSATPNPDSGRYDRAIRAWRRLPLGVANRLGPRLARAIP